MSVVAITICLVLVGIVALVAAAYWSAGRRFPIQHRGELLPPPNPRCVVSNWRAW